ncbi:MAG: thymidine phosphorylase [Tissierellia bacterium]|nr:thymidine phosphorylase [Tissierellia bacterium]
MNVLHMINRKKHGQALTEEEISSVVMGYTLGEIPDYQMSALLMAIYFQGMNEEETLALTRAMIHSGEEVTLEGISGYKVDKHSTGGVGDSTTLVLGPILAAMGLKLAKMSGRGLGHTGGTLDKLESIPGLSVDLTVEEIIEGTNAIGMVVVGQTADITPADKKMYALRDTTETVDSIPLIASSIMSKKLAIHNDALVLDVKVGDGAFMKDVAQGEELARTLVAIGSSFGRDTYALISSMEQPLGSRIGNSLEIIEAIEALKGNTDTALFQVVKTLATLLVKGKTGEDEGTIERRIHEVVASGAALKKFQEFVAFQGGSPQVVEDYSLLPQAAHSVEVPALKGGHVAKIPAEAVGNIARDLGAGRKTLDDELNLGAGIHILKRVGDAVAEGEALAVLYGDDPQALNTAVGEYQQLVEISGAAVEAAPMIHGVIHEQSR